MQFDKKIIPGKILKRYKRFLADIELKDGEVITAHTANTGSMKTCWEPGWKVLVSHHDDPKRKLKYSLEMTNNGDTWIGVNTSLPNKLAKEAIENGTIKELQGFENIRPEYKVGKSRIDLLLSKGDYKCFVEVKNVTMHGGDDLAVFPDGVTERGQKHLKELITLKKEGHRAVMLFIVQREDVNRFAPAKEIDPIYSDLLKQAFDQGVEILPYQCELNEKGVEVKRLLPFEL